MKGGPWARYAEHMLKGFYSPIPMHHASKKPLTRAWQVACTTAMSAASIEKLARERPQLGIAVAGGYGGLVPIDIDTDDAEVLAAYARAMPRPNVAKKGRRGLVCFYRAADGEPLPRSRDFMTPCLDRHGRKSKKPLISILTARKTVLPPSIHPKTGEQYRWLTKGTLYSKPVSNLVPISARHLEDLAVALRPWCPPPKPVRPAIVTPSDIVADKRMRAYALSTLRNEAKRLADMPRDSGRNKRLFDTGCVLGKYVHHKVLAFAEVEAALIDACRSNGLVAEDGETQCRQTLTSGLKKASGDALPALGYWGGSTR